MAILIINHAANGHLTVDTDWNETKHPRASKGSKSGGRFVAKYKPSIVNSNVEVIESKLEQGIVREKLKDYYKVMLKQSEPDSVSGSLLYSLNKHLEQSFPSMVNNFEYIGGRNSRFNCISTAFNDYTRWWWPDSFWPDEANYGSSVVSFDELLLNLINGKETTNREFELGKTKIALFTDSYGEPTHMARLLPNGRWLSKLGGTEEISHSLEDMEGSYYGKVEKIYSILDSEFIKLKDMK